MKKKIFNLMLFGIILMLPFIVSAEEVNTLDKFTKCVTGSSNTCTLTDDIIVDTPVDVVGSIVLDLNGHSITADDSLNSTLGVLIVHNGASLTVNDSVGSGKISTANTTTYTAILLTKSGDKDTEVASFTLNGGMLEGYWYGIAGNGNRYNTSVVINDGEVVGKNGMGIFNPQVGSIVVNGGTITGKSGIEIRSGSLEVNDGTIIGTGVPVVVSANGSGATSLGAGIAVAQHTTLNAIDVVINGGTIQGYSSLYESNPQGNSAEAIAKISITVKGGTLETINDGEVVIYSENDLITMEANLSDIVDTTTKVPVYGVLDGTGQIGYIYGSDLYSENLVVDAVDVESIDSTEVGLVEKTADSKYTITNYYDISLLLKYEESDVSAYVFETSNSIEVTLDIPEGLEKVKDGYERKYVIIRVHNGVSEVIETIDNGDGTLTFATDKFSTYALAYEDVEKSDIEESVVENNDSEKSNVKNPSTYDGISLYIFMGVISIIGLLIFGIYNRKKFN